jgi:hypothetical protein
VNKQCLPKQEIIDNLRLELSERDMKLIGARFVLKDAIELLKRTQARLEQWDTDNICTDDDLYTDILNTLPELEKAND